jgi:hypothetical protein
VESDADADEYRGEAALMQKRQAFGDQSGDYSTDSGEEGPPLALHASSIICAANLVEVLRQSSLFA